jgi:DNA-binding transcriptional ArsR family regulator
MKHKLVYVKYSNQQVRIAELRAQGKTELEIARLLTAEWGKNVSVEYVSGALGAFSPVADQMLRDCKRLTASHYWQRKRLNSFAATGRADLFSRHLRQATERRLLEGYYPRDFAPYGYKLKNRELIPDAKKASIVLAICRGRLAGKSVSALSNEFKLSYDVTARILTDAIYREDKPIITWDEKKYEGEHIRGIVPQDLWKQVQNTFTQEAKRSHSHRGSAPFGFKNLLLAQDEEKIEKVKHAFELRADKTTPRTYRQISENTGIPVTALHWIFTNKVYLEQGIVTHEVWNRVQELKGDASKFWERMGATTRANILDTLGKTGEMTTPEVAREVRIDVNDVRLHLAKLYDQGLVEARRSILRGKKVLIWRPRGQAKERNWFFHQAIDTTVPVEKVKAFFERLLQGPATARELSETTGRSRFTVRGWLYQLRARGIIELFQPNKGRWALKSEYARTIKEKLNS